MKTLLLFIILLTSSSSTLANEKFLCSALTLHKYKELIPKNEVDKVKHCSYSCILSKKCGVLESFTLGVAKEIADLLGYGTPEFEDLAANRKGIILGRKINTVLRCLPICQSYYDNGEI